MSSAPKNVPTMLPRPPIRLVPPTTTAAIDSSSSSPVPVCGEPDEKQRHVEKADDRRADAADHVDERLDARDVDAGQARRFFVAADREDVAAEARLVQEHGREEDDRDHPDDGNRNAGQMQQAR